MNLLFICSKNEWRSKTAETIFKNKNGISVKSAGTSKTARIKVSSKLLQWADSIFVMEDHHKKRIKQSFAEALGNKEIFVLHIPDEYKYMDPELIEQLEDVYDFHFN